HAQTHRDGPGLAVLVSPFKMSLGVLAQLIETFHRTFLHRWQVWHGNQPAEFVHRPFVSDLQNQILASGIINEDSLLRRLGDVLVLVPDEFWHDEHAVSQRDWRRKKNDEDRNHEN